MEVSLRPAAVSDASSIAAIYRPIVEETTISFEETAPDEAEMARRIGDTPRAYPWLVAERGSSIVGYAYASRHRERPCYRYSVDVSVYVAHDARGHGVGRTLYERLFELLSAGGFHRAFAGVTLPNDASIALHLACGFEAVGVYREVGRKFGKWLDVAWWQRSL
jgi:phosphinothricin acetyltransferase